MKVIFELPFKSKLNPQLTQFRWLNNQHNRMFILEDGKKIRTISVDTSPARELQFANLAEKRVCTCFSWNFDGSQLALVIDERQIYLWDVKLNQFNHYKPTIKEFVAGSNVHSSSSSSSASNQSTKRNPMSAICLVAWSMVTNKLVICTFGGQLIITNFTNPQDVTEKFIDNGSGILTRVIKLESCPYLDFFACVSESSEILVMTFDGISKYYVQGYNVKYVNIRFSPPDKKPLIDAFGDTVNLYINHQRLAKQRGSPSSGDAFQETNGPKQRNFHSVSSNLINEFLDDNPLKSTSSAATSIWVSYQFGGGKLRFKRIVFNFESPEMTSEQDMIFDNFSSTSDNYHERNAGFRQRDDNENGHQGPIATGPSKLIDHFWINRSSLICCHSLGDINLIEISQSNRINSYHPMVHNLLNIRADTQFLLNPSYSQRAATSPAWPPFKAFDFKLNATKTGANKRHNSSQKKSMRLDDRIDGDNDDMSKTNVLSIAAITSNEIFYYELIWSKEADTGPVGKNYINFHDEHGQTNGNMFSLERVDDLDLSVNLRKFQLELEKVAWSQDCSMLAVQLTGGYMLVYRTHLENQLIARCGPKTAHLSTPSEITVLNFQIYPDQVQTTATSSAIGSPSSPGTRSSGSSSNMNNNTNVPRGKQLKQSLVINVHMRPSILAIGPLHVAVGLNNRIRIYQTATIDRSGTTTINEDSLTDLQHQYLVDEARLLSELDYSSIVAKVELNSRYIATLFLDGRLKLSSIPVQDSTSDTGDSARERTFPDPGQRFERISSFCLTESIFLYCTQISLKLHVFCMNNWSLVQQCELSPTVNRPIEKLRANEPGNKFICLLKHTQVSSGSSVFLYDLIRNKIIDVKQDEHGASTLFKSILENQIKQPSLMRASIFDQREEDKIQLFKQGVIKSMLNSRPFKLHKFGQIHDVLWDTDGRNLILIERRMLHNIAILEHTLDTVGENRGLCIEHIASLSKPYNNEPVYLTQGVVSYQTKLGSMINSILYLYDDDLRLLDLERQIAQIQLRIEEDEAYYDEKIASLRHELQLKNEQKLLETQTDDDIKFDGGEDKSIGQQDNGRGGDDDDDLDDGKMTKEAREVFKLVFPRTELDVVRLKVAYLLSILPIYSLHKCKCILEHLATDEQYNLVPPRLISDTISADNNNSILLWRILAAWSIYTMNLNFALIIYRKCRLMSHARWLSNLIKNLPDRDSLRETRVKLLNELLELPNDEMSSKYN